MTRSTRGPSPVPSSDAARRRRARPRLPRRRLATPPGAPRRGQWVLAGTERPYPSPKPCGSPPPPPRGRAVVRSAPSLSGASSSPTLCPRTPPDPPRGHHGRSHRQRLDPPEAAGAGAALGPAVCQQEAEQPQQEPRALQRQPGGYLLQSAHLRPQEAQVAAPRSVWVTVGRRAPGSPRLPAYVGTLRVPPPALALLLAPTPPGSPPSARGAPTAELGTGSWATCSHCKLNPASPGDWPAPAGCPPLLSLLWDGSQRKSRSINTRRVSAYPQDRV